jgi:NAD(P)-dependent dehydrogenase (short-subunit alcohol dehydrogenase family)
LITGAGRGIGRAVAEAYAREGASLALCARSAEVEELAARLSAAGARVLARRADVDDEKSVGSLVDETVKRFGRLDVLVNNAAVLGPREPLLSSSPESWRETLAINATGAFLVLRACAAAMKARRSGSVINVTSGVGRRGRGGAGVYGVSKFAVEGLTQIAAAELKEFGVRVSALNPGPTRTAMRAAYAPDEDPAALKTAESIAWAFVALADPAGETGRSYDIDAAARRLIPIP